MPNFKVADLDPIKDLKPGAGIDPNIIPYLQYEQPFNPGDPGIGTKTDQYTPPKKPSQGKGSGQGKGSNYIENTGDPYIDSASRFNQEAHDILDEMNKIGNDFAQKGKDGWYKPNEKFGQLSTRLQRALNIITAIAMLMEAKNEMKSMQLELAGAYFENKQDRSGQEDISVLGVISKATNKQAKNSAQLAKSIFKFIAKQNETHKKELLDQAKKDAWKEAQNWMRDVGDFFGLDSTNRQNNENFAQKKEAIEKEYEKVQQEITKTYERLKEHMSQTLGKDAFSQRMKQVADKTTQDALIDKTVGANYHDLDKNKTLAYTSWFVSLQNARTVYFKVKLARERIYKDMMEELLDVKSRVNVDQALGKIFSDATMLERFLFFSYINQIQTQITAHNDYITAIFEREKAEEMNSFWTDPWFVLFAPIAGHMIFSSLYTAIVDWARTESFYDSHDNNFTPTDLNMDKVYELIDKLAGKDSDKNTKIKDNIDAFLSEMESKLNKLEKQLEKEGIDPAKDGYVSVNWMKVNRINERYASLQRVVAAIMTLVMTRGKLKSITLGKDPIDLEWVKETAKSYAKNSRLALDLKIDTLMKRVEETNRQRAEELELEKSQSNIGGAAVGGVLSAIVIVIGVVGGIFTGGTALAGAIVIAGIITSLVAAGQAIAEILFNYAHPPNDNIYKFKKFYDEFIISDKPEDVFSQALDRMQKKQHESVDQISPNKFITVDNKRALDMQAVIKARDEITSERIVQLAMMMILKTRANLRLSMLAEIGGTPMVLADYEGIESSLQEDYDNLLKAFEYKVMVANDEINAYNARAEWNQSIEDAWVSFAVNVASAVTSVVSSGLGSYSKLLDSGAIEKIAGKVAIDAGQIGLRTYDLVRTYEQAQDHLGLLLKDTQMLNGLINEIYRLTNNIRNNNMKRLLRQAAKTINTNLVEGIGDGRYAVNVKHLFRVMRQVESAYYAEIAKEMIIAAQNEVKAKMLKTSPTGQEVIDALYQDMEKAKAVINHLFQRVEDYVKFLNKLSEAQKKVVMKTAAYAVFLVNKANQTTDGKITKAITDSLGHVLKSLTAGVLDLGKIEIELPFQSLNKGVLDIVPRTLNASDVLGMAVNILLSENFAQRIAKLAVKQSEKGLDKQISRIPQGPESSKPAATSVNETANVIDRLEYQTNLASERIGEAGFSQAKFEVLKSLEQELKQFIMALIKSAPDSYKAARQARLKKDPKIPFSAKLNERLSDVETERKKQVERLKEIPAQITQVEKRLRACQSEVAKVEKNTKPLKDRLEQLLAKPSKNPNLKPQVDHLKAQLADLKQQLKEEMQALKEIRQSLDKSKQKAKQLQQAAENLKQKIKSLKAKVVGAKLNPEDPQVKELQNLEKQLQILEAGRVNLQKEVSEIKKQVQAKVATIKQIQGEMQAINQGINIISRKQKEKEDEKTKKAADFSDTVALATGRVINKHRVEKSGFIS